MLIYNRQAYSEVNGPGMRCIIWVAGCSLQCPKCWNPNSHAFDETKRTNPEEIAEWVSSLEGIEGVTFSGGEPLEQAPDLHVLISLIKEMRPELSFGMYTGYTLKELEEGRYKWHSSGGWTRGTQKLWHRIKANLDFAVMGRYNQLARVQDNSRPLLGSLNQEIVFFSYRYTKEDLKGGYEVIIPADGLTSGMTGFPVNIT